MSTYSVPYCAGKKANKTIVVKVPGSKSITNRALLVAALAKGKSNLEGCLRSDDANHLLSCLKELGFDVKEDEKDKVNVSVEGLGGSLPKKQAEIYVGSAGTAARFLVAMLSFMDGEYIVNSSEQMKKRPMQPLIDALRGLGAEITCLENEGYFPFKVKGISDLSKLPDSVEIDIDKSSQFLSALMIAAGNFKKDFSINIIGSHGLAYVDMTAQVMKDFGVEVVKLEEGGKVSYKVLAGEGYKARDYYIEPDMSAAAYFYGLAAILSQKVAVKGVNKAMLQGDIQFIDVLEKLGATVSYEVAEGMELLVVKGPEGGLLKGNQTFDLSSFSDQTLTLSAIAPFADGKIRITGVDHIRLQECDRINAIVTNLTNLGVKVSYDEQVLEIEPSAGIHGGSVETFEDHRVSMSFALTGLRVKGVEIFNCECCSKTFKEYFNVLDEVVGQLV